MVPVLISLPERWPKGQTAQRRAHKWCHNEAALALNHGATDFFQCSKGRHDGAPKSVYYTGKRQHIRD